MSTYSVFLPDMMLRAQQLPEPLAISALRDTCIEFCRQTGWLVYEHTPITPQAGVRDYPLMPPNDTTVSMIDRLWIGDQLLKPTTVDTLSQQVGEDWRNQTGYPRAYLLLAPDTLTLTPTPDSTVTDLVNPIVWLQPSRDSTTVDDSLYEWFKEGITGGALARCMAVPGQPYSNPQAASYYQLQFNTALSDARTRRQREHARGPLRVQMRRW